MKTLNIILIVVVVATLAVLGLYAADQTRPMVQSFGSTLWAGLSSFQASVIENPMWIAYVSPWWGYALPVFGIVVGAMAYKFYYNWRYIEPVRKDAQIRYGDRNATLQNAPREPEREASIPAK